MALRIEVSPRLSMVGGMAAPGLHRKAAWNKAIATRTDDFAAEAERARILFQNLRVEAAGNTQEVTVSVSLLSLGAPPKLQDLSAAMKRADELMSGTRGSSKARSVSAAA